jgi:hypothetical protein
MSEEIKKQKRQIIVEFTVPKNKSLPILSWIIRLFQWKFWRGQKFGEVASHTRIKFFDLKHQVWWQYEASQTKVRLIGDYGANITKVVKQYELYVDPEIKKQMIININHNVGKSYGFKQLIGLIFVVIFKRFGLIISNPLADGNKRQVCTEAIYWVLYDNPDFRQKLDQYKPDSLDLCDIIEVLEEII